MREWSIGWGRAVVPVLAALAVAPPARAAEATPEKVAAAVAELENLAGKTMARTGVPGLAAVVVHRDGVVYAKGLGVRAAGKADPVDADTVFLLASVSKPITATVLAIQVGLGALGWDDRVLDRDPDFR